MPVFDERSSHLAVVAASGNLAKPGSMNRRRKRHRGRNLRDFKSRAATSTLRLRDWSSADAAFHLQFDQAVHFDRIFHRQLFDEWFDESGNDHG